MFGIFKRKKSATIAKDRLTIAIMSDRNNGSIYPFIEDMKQEILDVVKKYIEVKNIRIEKEVDADIEALSIDIELDIK